jgi:hypothetical protein
MSDRLLLLGFLSSHPLAKTEMRPVLCGHSVDATDNYCRECGKGVNAKQEVQLHTTRDPEIAAVIAQPPNWFISRDERSYS